MITLDLVSDAHRLAARAIAADLEKTWAKSHRETRSHWWPRGCCVEASVSLRDELQEKLPAVGAEYVWGSFVFFDLPRPWYVHDPGAAAGHAWVELRVDGTILDITAGQFLGGPALWMLAPGSPFRRHYVAEEYGTP